MKIQTVLTVLALCVPATAMAAGAPDRHDIVPAHDTARPAPTIRTASAVQPDAAQVIAGPAAPGLFDANATPHRQNHSR
jgi:hypothetical protein